MEKDKCVVCGETKDTIKQMERVTEGNYKSVSQCKDRVGCWDRYDRANGLK